MVLPMGSRTLQVSGDGGNAITFLHYATLKPKYVGHLESKERLRYNPRSCLILADESCGVFSRVWTVAW